MKQLTAIFFTSLVFCLASFMSGGEEFARMSFDKAVGSSTEITQVAFDNGFKSQTFELEAGDQITLYTDIDIEYEGSILLDFLTVMVSEDNDTVHVSQTIPNDSELATRHTSKTFGSKKSESFKTKIGRFKIPENNTYFLKSIFRSSINKSLTLSKADVVVMKSWNK